MFTKTEQRSWIKIEMARSRSTQGGFQGLREACDDVALSYRTVADWLKRSEKAGMLLMTTSVQDDPTWRTT